MVRDMPDENQQSRFASVVAAILLLIAAPIALLFLPLLLALVESATVGSGHVEDLCRAIGVHDFLSAIYRPIVGLFGVIVSSAE